MKILVSWLISIFLFTELTAQSIDLSSVQSYEVRQNLRPVLSVMASQHELPAPAGFFNFSRKLVFSTSLYNVYNVFNDSEYGTYIPSFWGGFVASPNLSLFMQIAHGKMQGENIATFGPVINFIWGDEARKNVINLSVIHLRGPDDFKVKDIALTIMKKHQFGDNLFYYGFAPHYLNVNIDVEKTDLKKTINETIYHLRTGFYRNINIFDFGFEMDICQETIITKFNLVAIL